VARNPAALGGQSPPGIHETKTTTGAVLMLTPQFVPPIANELVIDLFAGGGGASTGIEQAIGRHVDIAINHDPEAVNLHQANHPQTRHFVSDVFEVDPLEVTEGRPVGLLWASPDCKHFSKAKGGKPVSKKIRSLAWVVVKWAKLVKPRVIFLENVEEFQTWGPLEKRTFNWIDDLGQNQTGVREFPDQKRKGETFAIWKRQLENLGYVIEHKELRACDYGAPTIRKRLFLIARCDGMPIVWPEPTHAAPDSLAIKAKKLKPWRTAADCIDWTITAPSIFERKKPLAEATNRRIAKGIMRYVVDAKEPYIVKQAAPFLTEHANASSQRTFAADEPLRTQMAQVKGGHFALVVPTLIQTGYGERPGQAPRVPGLDKPLGTLVATQKHALVSAFMTKFNTGSIGFSADSPMHTITAGGEQARPGTAITQGIVAAHMVHMGHGEQSADGSKRWSHGVRDVVQPLNTITASGAPGALVTSNLLKLNGDNVEITQNTHHDEVRAFMVTYYGTDQNPALLDPLHTITTKDRFGLVMVKGEPYAIVDIGLRMLAPRELYRAQGFPESYAIDKGADGRPLTKTAQVRMCGNSVCPPLARAIVSANYITEEMRKAA
jgi:DNA (cytosine-5)-methyltransferase 1